MTISDTTEQAILDLIFFGTTWANYAINATTSPQTTIEAALHTADPGETGTMSTSEATYTSYARQSTARTSGGWTRTASSVSPNAIISFPAATAGSNTITYASIGKSGGGATAILFSGTVTPNISVTTPVAPQLGTATAVTLD
jgi:hypothetical protein